MKPLAEDAWDSWRPKELAQRLHGSGITWYVTGGWALDLFLGQQTRDHADLEFATLPSDIPKTRGALSELEFFTARNGQLSFLERDADVPDDIWQLWGADLYISDWILIAFVTRWNRTQSCPRWRRRRRLWGGQRLANLTIGWVLRTDRSKSSHLYIRNHPRDAFSAMPDCP